MLNYDFVKKNLLIKKRLRKLTNMLSLDWILKHQYRARNYQRYLELVQDLPQVEKHDELYQCFYTGKIQDGQDRAFLF
jgi:hypothetical protein